MATPSKPPFDALHDTHFDGDRVVGSRDLARRLNRIETLHFMTDVVKGGQTLAPTPGTADATAMAHFGALHISSDRRIESCDAHVISDGSSGTMALELYRLRDGVAEMIGSISVPAGGGDFTKHAFTITDPILVRDDHLLLQPTSTMSGSGQGTMVDVHFDDEKQGVIA